MKKQFFLGLAAIVGLGVAAAAVVVLSAQRPDGTPGAAEPAPAREAVTPPADSIPPAPVQGPQGPPYLQLSPATVARDVTAAQSHCHRVNAIGPGSPAVLTLELEARDGGGFVVVDARVASQGGASEGLVLCASQVLLGRRVEEGAFSPGEHFLARYELEPPPQATNTSEQPATPTSLSVSRQQLRQRGGSR